MRIVSLLFHDVYFRDPSESGFDSAAADRYKLPLAEFDAQLRGVARVRGDEPVLAGEMLAAGLKACATTLPGLNSEATTLAGPNSGATTQQSAAQRFSPASFFTITVDDGGESYYTVAADRLEALGWCGHCFVTTDEIGRPGFVTASQIRQLDARGHAIGSHTASHPARFSTCTPERMRTEWTQSRQALEDIVGHEVTIASVPGGAFSTAVARAAAEAGARVLFTSEPTTAVHEQDGCLIVGRFTVRAGSRRDFASRIVLPSSQTRQSEWTGWNAKKLIKPLLGSTYARVADWLLAPRT